jgi:uncharacterized coiled-coil protein SlyX
MAAIFQLRRGSGSVSLVDGELYVNKGIDSLQYAVGDREITLLKLDELNTGTLNLNGGISASGDITASNAYISGNVVLGGTITIGDTTNDSVIFNADLSSSIIPDATSTYDLGSTSKVYRNIYASNVSASAFTGSLFGMGDPTSFSTSVDTRLDYLEGPFSTSVDSRMDLLEDAMSGSNRLYVSPQGTDTTGSVPHGTQHNPYKTIKAAVESLGSAVASNIKRYTIFVGSGNYTENNPIAVPPGVAIVGDTLRTVRLTASNPTKDYFHCHDSNYFYGLRFLDLKHPAFAFSYPCSTAIGTISAGGVSGLTMIHTESGYVNGESVNVIIEGPDASGSVATATATISGGVLSINMVNNGSGYVAGEKPHISIQAPTSKRPVIGTSPYIQNCSSITGPITTDGVALSLNPASANYAPLPYNINDVRNASNAVIGSGIIDEQGAGGGIRIDGNLVSGSSPLESFVADAFTQVNQGGPGHLVINKGYAQFVSCFTTFCTYGFKVANGGFANISNSVIDFGAKGLVSKTYFPQTYNTGSSLQTLTSTVVGAVIQQDGAGYTGSVADVTITGGGVGVVQATAEATINANGSIDEIVILTPGSGYTSQPTLTIAAPTGPGAIQATTVAGKAQISGINAILFQLESGSRGVDVSSNMILNGTDYLVTNVATGSNSTERYVTVYPAPPSITTGNNVYFHQLSNISTGGLVMEYVGSGVTYNALPKFGGVPNRNREIVEYAPGRVFYSTVDNIGNLKIGDFFAVNQLTGEVTIDANQFNLSGLSAIGPFKRNGVGVGVVLNEVSNNTTLLNAQGITGEDTVPTQFAVKGYIDIRDGRLNNLETFTASISGTNAFTSSTNGRLNNLESKSASVDISISNLHSYTSSLNNAIQLTGSTVSFLGNIVVYGTQSIINSTNLEVADNMIYLNSTSSTTNVDLGIVGNYNDGTYGHTGIYRDAADGVWRVFKGYTPEPEGNIDLAHASYQYADFYANALSASTLSGIGNITTYSTSVDSRLFNLETKSGSVDTLVANLNHFSASVTASLEKIYQTTSSLNTATSSLYISTSLMSASIVSLTASVSTLQTFSENVNTKFTTLGIYTASVDGRLTNLESKSASVDISITNINLFSGSTLDRLTNLESKSASVDVSISNINTFTQSVNGRFTTLATYTGSIDSDLTSIHQTTSSLNQFSASISTSVSTSLASIIDHEDRITYVEGLNGISGGNPLIPLNQFSASAKISITNLETFSSSTLTRLSQIESYTSSTNTRLGGIESYTSSTNIRLSEIESYTSSLKSAISLNGTNVTINGDLSVLGTTTQINSTQVNIGDNILELNYGGSATTAGIITKDATGASTTSGSLLWNTTNDNWTAGKLGSEAKILTDGMGVISGSSQISLGSASGNVTLSTQTTGNYVASLVEGTGVTITNNSGENATPTITIGQSVATSANAQFASLGIGMAATGTAGRIDASGDIVAFSTSDERLKENIQPIQNALSKVETISGNEYNWKEEFENIHGFKGNDVGVIAQEIQKILPQAVMERDNGYLGVNYEKIIPLLIQSIKELSAKVKELENK